jgi:hypothetical protein
LERVSLTDPSQRQVLGTRLGDPHGLILSADSAYVLQAAEPEEILILPKSGAPGTVKRLPGRALHPRMAIDGSHLFLMAQPYKSLVGSFFSGPTPAPLPRSVDLLRMPVAGGETELLTNWLDVCGLPQGLALNGSQLYVSFPCASDLRKITP